MEEINIALITESRYIDPNPSDDYKKDVLHEDRVLSEALAKKGITTVRVDWADQKFDWSRVQYAMFRSTWDYFYRIEEFKLWLAAAGNDIELINPLSLINWNLDKHYLKDLSLKGVPIVPTLFVEQGEAFNLIEYYRECESDKLIIKPAISGTARHTYLIDESNLNEHEPIFKKLINEECMLIQPYLSNIANEGEVSFLVFGGEYSHSVLKKAKTGDFRVQSDFGGTVHAYIASKEEIKFVRDVITACEKVPVYARVDVARDDNGNMVLVELELIEPDMWLRLNEGSSEKLSEAIFGYIKQGNC